MLCFVVELSVVFCCGVEVLCFVVELRCCVLLWS